MYAVELGLNAIFIYGHYKYTLLTADLKCIHASDQLLMSLNLPSWTELEYIVGLHSCIVGFLFYFLRFVERVVSFQANQWSKQLVLVKYVEIMPGGLSHSSEV